ncbi:MAG: hypothetical protein ACOC3U_02185 [Thiohalospira sp.]
MTRNDACYQPGPDLLPVVEARRRILAAARPVTGTEMVDLLDVGGPRDATPRQFERKAIDAGMDPTDVGVLTRTFEEVRYGDDGTHYRAALAKR